MCRLNRLHARHHREVRVSAKKQPSGGKEQSHHKDVQPHVYSTHGGPGCWNDQTMVRLDQFISGVRDGYLLQDNDFELLDYDHLGNLISVKYKGVYVIVDNGYLQWLCIVPPYTITSDMDEIRWSKWLESMRKDVECTFGILKGKWCILKSGICLQGVDAVDNIWLTCYALHNWLLEIDGLNAEWSEVSMPGSDWEGDLGDCDFEGINVSVPWLIARLSQRLEPRTLDLSGMGQGIDVVSSICSLTQRMTLTRLELTELSQ
jgi:hypothetical protein